MIGKKGSDCLCIDTCPLTVVKHETFVSNVLAVTIHLESWLCHFTCH